jgi:uncharacterized protein
LKYKTSTAGIIIFIRNPELGKVKTRLATSVGDDKALHIYVELLRHTREVCSEVVCNRYLYYSDTINHTDDWSDALFIKRLQSSGDLGVKMQSAFEEVLNETDKVIIIGSDSPQISPDYINGAYEALDNHDVVIGPTYDGGYYLLGMKKMHKSLFQDIAWSTESVFDQTVAKFNKESLSYKVLDQLADIDYAEDWKKWGWEIL